MAFDPEKPSMDQPTWADAFASIRENFRVLAEIVAENNLGWQCAYCDSIHKNDVFRCRSCGSPRTTRSF
jgi:hypothetical protein